MLAEHGIPGAGLAWIEDGRTVAVRAFGSVDAAGSEPVTPETAFLAGSISKHVTTVAALRLASDGLLDLDRDVNGYLSEWRMPTEPGHPAAARMLLSNLDGFADRPQLSDGYHRHGVVPSLLDVLHGRSPARTPAARYERRGIRAVCDSDTQMTEVAAHTRGTVHGLHHMSASERAAAASSATVTGSTTSRRYRLSCSPRTSSTISATISATRSSMVSP
ncbi:serine hydrolase domain-containing protein [Kitasatospora acidiphila]|uniref:serine hydrolase domain-containing protein n=1 Tax=Kitasatospora acidiphila TaxID=2567942 RepID=UPI0015F11E06|nr:serine hydrolase domain-containing protein [Kitasatospora acidiphila]